MPPNYFFFYNKKKERCMIEMYIFRKRKIKFNKIAEEWLEIKKIKVKESTYCNYCYTMNRYIIPNFEKMSLRKLEKFNYNDFILELLEELSSKIEKKES